MLIGYARLSTDDQTLDLQRDALKEAGCERIFEDTAGGTAERPNLQQALSHRRAGDTLVVWRLDRLGRSLKDLIAQAEQLRSRGVGLKSLKEAIDTDSPTGQLVFHIFGALAEFERALIRERTQAGLQAARARVRKGGRRKRLDREQREHAVELYRSRKHTVKQICNLIPDGGLASDTIRLCTGVRRWSAARILKRLSRCADANSESDGGGTAMSGSRGRNFLGAHEICGH